MAKVSPRSSSVKDNNTLLNTLGREGKINLDVFWMDFPDALEYTSNIGRRLREKGYHVEGEFDDGNYRMIYSTLGRLHNA